VGAAGTVAILSLMKAYLWAALMVLWLVGLAAGLWWYWPLFATMALTADFVAAFFYLFIGALAWLIAFSMGRQHYWRR
jgi:hypothetical protein